MSIQLVPICGEHKKPKEWRLTTFEYVDDEDSFTTDIVDELIPTVRELVEMARKARERGPVLTEYTIAIGH